MSEQNPRLLWLAFLSLDAASPLWLAALPAGSRRRILCSREPRWSSTSPNATPQSSLAQTPPRAITRKVSKTEVFGDQRNELVSPEVGAVADPCARQQAQGVGWV